MNLMSDYYKLKLDLCLNYALVKNKYIKQGNLIINIRIYVWRRVSWFSPNHKQIRYTRGCVTESRFSPNHKQIRYTRGCVTEARTYKCPGHDKMAKIASQTSQTWMCYKIRTYGHPEHNKQLMIPNHKFRYVPDIRMSGAWQKRPSWHYRPVVTPTNGLFTING